MAVHHMLTTIDNPNNPFTDYDAWRDFDEMRGYHTEGYIARIAVPFEHLTEEEKDEERERAIQEILDNDVIGMYIRVTKDTPIHPIDLTVAEQSDTK